MKKEIESLNFQMRHSILEIVNTLACEGVNGENLTNITNYLIAVLDQRNQIKLMQESQNPKLALFWRGGSD